VPALRLLPSAALLPFFNYAICLPDFLPFFQSLMVAHRQWHWL
jgi:hypothetical protein